MAYYPITMNQVKQIYKLHCEGVAIKRIATILGISKNTVKAYLRKKPELALCDDQLMATENPVLAYQLKPVSTHRRIIRRFCSGPNIMCKSFPIGNRLMSLA